MNHECDQVNLYACNNILNCECDRVICACDSNGDSVNLNDECDPHKCVCDIEYLNHVGKIAELNYEYGRGNPGCTCHMILNPTDDQSGQKCVYNDINQSYKPGIMCRELSKDYGVTGKDENVNKSVIAKSVVHSLHKTRHNQALNSDSSKRIIIKELKIKGNFKSEARSPHSLEINHTTFQSEPITLENNKSKTHPHSVPFCDIKYSTLGGTDVIAHNPPGGTMALQSTKADGPVHLNRYTHITYAQALNSRVNPVIRHKVHVSNTNELSVNNEKHTDKNSHSKTNGCKMYSKYIGAKHGHHSYITIIHCNKESKPGNLNIQDIDQKSDTSHNHRKKCKMKKKNISGWERVVPPNVQKYQPKKSGCDVITMKCSNRFSKLQGHDNDNDLIDGTPVTGSNNRTEGSHTVDNQDLMDDSLDNQTNAIFVKMSHKSTPGSNSIGCQPQNINKKNRHRNQLKLKAAVFNAQSLNSKIHEVSEYIKEQDLDLYMITELWFNEKNATNINKLKQGGFEMKHTPRLQRMGGGISVIYRQNLEVSKVRSPPVKTCELMEILVKNKVKRLRFVIIYRPEPDPKNPAYTMTEFYEEFTSLVAHYMTYKEEVIFCGDYNFHVNDPGDTKSNKFREILETFDLIQHVKESTHRDGNTLDLIITKRESSILSHSVDLMLSDHCNILMDVDMRKPPPIKKEVTYRKTRSIDKDRFKTDIKLAMENITINDNLQDMVTLYNDKLIEVFDKHAPEQTKVITVRKHTPWTTEEIKPEKQLLRKLERKMKKTKLEIDKQNFKDQKLKYKKILDDKRTKHYSNLIEENSNDPKGLFKVINTALNKKENTVFPTGVSDGELANEFLDFFDGKIDNIRSELDGPSNNIKPKEFRKYQYELNEFRLLSEDEVKKLMMSSGNKYCELDPLPTSLLKDSIDDVLPLITQIINLSLGLGDMPLSLKKAIIKPLLKKLGLELEKKNYRPVSNLAYISKLIEKAVAFQLIDHLKRNNLYDKFQSAYRQFHSTETALLRVKNDVLNAMDNQNITLMLLLDLSAAFDTIDHDILLNRLKERCGIGGTIIKWMKSYLTDRTQIVKINNSISETRPLKVWGTPRFGTGSDTVHNLHFPLGRDNRGVWT